MSDVVVLGAGVSGLTCAITLLEKGFNIRILADAMPGSTTSAMAGANWSPYMVSHPLAVGWSETTLTRLTAMATDARTGVSMVDGLEAATGDDVEAPAWAQGLASFRYCHAADLPAGYRSGWRFRIPVLDMRVYLEHLRARLAAAGVVIEQRRLESIEAAFEPAKIVVNCTGMGAARLCGDDGMVPIRGQLVVVRNPGISTFFQDHDESEDMTYFLPQGSHVVMGGSAIAGSFDLVPDPAISRSIISRCAAIEPRLGLALVLEVRVGVRPSRNPVRVEAEHSERGVVIHNYGHGGSGVTLSWGCAETVAQLAVAHGVEGHERDV